MEEGTHHGGVESEDGDGEEGVQDAEEDPHVYGLRTVASVGGAVGSRRAHLNALLSRWRRRESAPARPQ